MPAATFGARPVVTFGGQRLPVELEAAVLRVVVHSDATGPDSCTLTLSDPGRDALKRAGVEFLADMVVHAAPTGQTTEEPLFDGLVYSLGFEYDDAGAATVITGLDRSHKLYTGRHTTTYQSVTDADLAQQLAKEAGLQCEADSTSVVHPFLGQVNETHFELLSRRAREIGFQVNVSGGTLRFKQAPKASEGPQPGGFDAPGRLQLAPGMALEQFTARVTAAQQVEEVEVRGWDPKEKKAVQSKADAHTDAAAVPDDPADLAAKAGGAQWVVTDVPLSTEAEASALAKAEAERLTSTAVYAEGVASGDPRIVAGALVSVGQTGGRFDGQYVVTAAKHTFGASGYRTAFTVSGGHDRSLLGLVDPADGERGRSIDGVVVGIVTNVADDEGQGRVKVKLPWLSDDYETDWARVLQLGAGPDRGLLLLPEVDDEVLVAFEQGDPRRPYVLGGLFNGKDKPWDDAEVSTSNGAVEVRALRSRFGHEIVLREVQGKEAVEIRTKDAKVEVVLDHAGGHLTITTDKDVVVKAGGDAKVTSDGSVEVKASRDVSINAGGSLKLEATGDVAIKGAVVKLN